MAVSNLRTSSSRRNLGTLLRGSWEAPASPPGFARSCRSRTAGRRTCARPQDAGAQLRGCSPASCRSSANARRSWAQHLPRHQTTEPGVGASPTPGTNQPGVGAQHRGGISPCYALSPAALDWVPAFPQVNVLPPLPPACCQAPL
jgi:hypothetical protein